MKINGCAPLFTGVHLKSTARCFPEGLGAEKLAPLATEAKGLSDVLKCL